ncbi:growth hormone-regulated TBC protein 1-A-like [Lytechinus variegatus]|uniref:growth hormone-regulated TBC protein 1-A-like n=1 Tax=Lytechinus variegatus TaxID=7654 RepID=UPI001BB1587A|nr:growth hormone-regulated TBC protein 1-A-like [Lytechinus variegatus]
MAEGPGPAAAAAATGNSTREEREDLLLYRSEIDGYGFKRPDDFDYETYEEFMKQYLSVLARRAKKWEIVIKGSQKVKKSRKMKRYIRKGIPSEHRGTVWMMVSGALKLKKKNPGLYQHLLDAPKDPDIVEVINIDLHRTFPDNIHFSNDAQYSKRTALSNVLVAFAHHRPEVGYCQGLNFIVALMLLVLQDEENCFFLLLQLTTNILPDYYVPHMSGLKTDQEVLGELIKEKCPDVARHMEKEQVPWSIPTTKWFICLFLDVLPVETVLRIWDCLFYEGSKILFRVCLSLIKRNEEEIIRATNISALVDVFKKVTAASANIDCHTFLEEVFQSSQPLKRGTIEKLRYLCRQRVEQGP